MAIIGKIQKKTGLLLIVVAGGLVLFLIQGALDSFRNSTSEDPDLIGIMDGSDIKRGDYMRELEIMKVQHELQTNNKPTENDLDRLHPQVWQKLMFTKGFKRQLDELGIDLSDEEEIDMIQGSSIHPALLNVPAFQTNGKVDVRKIQQYIRNMENMEIKSIEQQKQKAQWDLFLLSVTDNRLQEKYTSLLDKTVYVTKAEAQRDFLAKNSQATYDYLYVPFSAIPDSTIEVTDDKLKEYLEPRKSEFKARESRYIGYVSFKMNPTKADTAVAMEKVTSIRQELVESAQDSNMVISRTEGGDPIKTYEFAAIPYRLKKDSAVYEDTASLKINYVSQPILEGQVYKLYDVLGYLPNDSLFKASASHILIQPDTNTIKDVAQAERIAKDSAEYVLSEALKSGASFESLAAKYSDGPSKTSGGKLGEFGNYGQLQRMVQPFQDAVFAATEEGVISKVVKTQFGYHIIKVDKLAEKKNPEYVIAEVEVNLKPGEETRDSVFNKASIFLKKCKDYTTMDKLAEEDSLLEVVETHVYTPDRRRIAGVNDVKHVVGWSYNGEREEGEIYENVVVQDDKIVVFGLKTITNKGQKRVQDIRTNLEFKYKKQIKADQIIAAVNEIEGTLQERAKILNEKNHPNYAQMKNVLDGKLSEISVRGLGNEPGLIGTAFGLKDDSWSTALMGENGVYIVQLKKLNKAEEPENGDYTKAQEDLQKTKSNGNSINSLNNAFIDLVEIKDMRYKI